MQQQQQQPFVASTHSIARGQLKHFLQPALKSLQPSCKRRQVSALSSSNLCGEYSEQSKRSPSAFFAASTEESSTLREEELQQASTLLPALSLQPALRVHQPARERGAAVHFPLSWTFPFFTCLSLAASRCKVCATEAAASPILLGLPLPVCWASCCTSGFRLPGQACSGSSPVMRRACKKIST